MRLERTVSSEAREAGREARPATRGAGVVPDIRFYRLRRISSSSQARAKVHRQHLIVRFGRDRVIVQFHGSLAAAVTLTVLAPGVVGEDAAHGFGGGGEELVAVLPAAIFLADQFQPRFVDQGGGLEGLAGIFLRHFVRSQAAQFRIDERQELVGGLGLAAFHCFQHAGDIAHALEFIS